MTYKSCFFANSANFSILFQEMIFPEGLEGVLIIIAFVFGVKSKNNHYQDPYQMISSLTFKSLIHFEFIFVCGIR